MREFRRENLNLLLNLLKQNDFITRKELSEELQVSTNTIQIYINLLKNKGYDIVCKKGPGGGIQLIKTENKDKTI